MIKLSWLVSSSFLTLLITAPFYPDKDDLLYYRESSGARRAVASPDQWEVRRRHILENMQEVMGPLPGAERRVPLDVEVLEEKDFGSHVQRKITFAVEPGDRVPAYLLLPKGISGKAPAMLCLHPTSEHGKAIVLDETHRPNRLYARELAERGFVTLAPDYPGFGEYAEARKWLYANGYVSTTMKAIFNHSRAIDLLSSLEEVDPERIGAIGHSLGGHNSLYLGVFEPRVKVMVTSCGFNTFRKYYGGNLTGWSHDGYMPRIATEYGKDPAQMPFDFTEVLGALAPRPVFINAPIHDANFEVSGVQDCVRAAQPVYELLGAPDNLVAVYPEAEHDFPDAVREQAYQFIEKQLGH